jgi:hypothetical protein
VLYAGLDSWRADSLFRKLHIAPLQYGEITTMIYLKVSVSDFLTLFSARAGDRSCFTTLPAAIVCFAAAVALGSSTMFATFWPTAWDHIDNETPIIGLSRGGNKLLPLVVWVYCLACWVVQDLVKMATFRLCYKYRIFGAVAESDLIISGEHVTAGKQQSHRNLYETQRSEYELAVPIDVKSKLIESLRLFDKIRRTMRHSQFPSSRRRTLMRSLVLLLDKALRRCSAWCADGEFEKARDELRAVAVDIESVQKMIAVMIGRDRSV